MTAPKRVPSLAELRLGIGRKRKPGKELLRQTELAKRVGITQAHVSAIETGNARPSIYLLDVLARFYELDLDSLRASAAETHRRKASGEPQK